MSATGYDKRRRPSGEEMIEMMEIITKISFQKFEGVEAPNENAVPIEKVPKLDLPEEIMETYNTIVLEVLENVGKEKCDDFKLELEHGRIEDYFDQHLECLEKRAFLFWGVEKNGFGSFFSKFIFNLFFNNEKKLPPEHLETLMNDVWILITSF